MRGNEMSQARVTIAIDSATADEAHDFVAAFQRFKGKGDNFPPHYGPNLPTVTIMGSWSWNVTLPVIYSEDASKFMAIWDAVKAEHAIPEWEKALLESSPDSAD